MKAENMAEKTDRDPLDDTPARIDLPGGAGMTSDP